MGTEVISMSRFGLRSLIPTHKTLPKAMTTTRIVVKRTDLPPVSTGRAPRALVTDFGRSGFMRSLLSEHNNVRRRVKVDKRLTKTAVGFQRCDEHWTTERRNDLARSPF